MDDKQRTQRELEIVELIRQTQGDWNELRIHFCAGPVFQAIPSSDPDLPLRVPTRAVVKMRDLRRAMADPQRGAWLMADVVVPRNGEATFDYDWMGKPDWSATGGTFSNSDDAGYLQDLAQFPRSPENIPDWYPTPGAVAPVPESTDTDDEVPPPPPPRRGDSPDVALTGLSHPFGVAIDSAGTLYVSDSANNRVIAVAAGTGQPVVLPFNGLWEPCGVAVDHAGTVYVADSLNNRVLRLAAGADSATEVPITGLNYPGGIAVDGTGNLYIADRGSHQVVKLAAGTSTPTVLPFNGISDPVDVAVDTAGAVYATDGTMHSNDPSSGRVLKLDPDAESSVALPISGLRPPFGVTVDNAGDVYITEEVNDGRVLKYSSRATTSVVTGLHKAGGVAVDAAGNIYVADETPTENAQSDDRVLKVVAR